MNTENVFFRLMREEDAERAAEMEAQSSTEAWTAKAYRDAVGNPNAIYIVAQINQTVVGCCGLWQSFEDADICNVVVDSKFRRHKIAENMLLVLMDKGKASGVENFTLEVRKGNIPAVQLYGKLGFVIEGIRKGFYDNPKEDALIMWKR